MKFDTDEEYIAWFKANATVPVVFKTICKPLEDVITDEQLYFFNNKTSKQRGLAKEYLNLLERDDKDFVKTIETIPNPCLKIIKIPQQMKVVSLYYSKDYVVDDICFKSDIKKPKVYAEKPLTVKLTREHEIKLFHYKRNNCFKDRTVCNDTIIEKALDLFFKDTGFN
jgi:predicted DNA-binding protein YlxM (UPF0122 family)